MWKLLCLTLLVCAVSGLHPVRRQAGFYQPLSSNTLKEIRNSSLHVLQDAMKVAAESLVSAAEQLNTTKVDCVGIVEEKMKTLCQACVLSRCENKVNSCQPRPPVPNFWGALYMTVEDFFMNKVPVLLNSAVDDVLDVPDIIIDSMDLSNWDDFLLNVGTDALDTVLDVGNVFVNIGGEVGDAVGNIGTSIWDGIQDVGNFLGDTALDVGNFLVDGIGDIGFDIGNIAADLGSTISGAIGDFGDLIGGLFNFGKKKRDAPSQVRSEPSCSQLLDPQSEGCMLYMPICGNICDTTWLKQQYCTTLNTSITDFQEALQSNFWFTTTRDKNQTFVIHKVMVDGSSYNPITFGYNIVTVEITMFGETYNFNLDNGYSPFDPGASGQEIAHKAIDHYKANHPPPSARVYTFGHN